jgi:hypothetical protein
MVTAMTNHEAADILRNIDCCANLADIKGAESAIYAAISALRAQEKEPNIGRKYALTTGLCPMCEDCPDGCPVETPNDSRNRPENEPLTLSELYDIDSEPLYFHCMVGHWSLNGWHIVKAINYDGAQFKDVQLDNNDAHIESLYNYGITWLAYRAKPERSEGE